MAWKLEKLEWKNWNGERGAALSGVVSFVGRLTRRPDGRRVAGGNGFGDGETLIGTLKLS